MKNLWFKLNKLYNKLSLEIYYDLPKRKKKQLEDDYNIDCGKDYADYLLDEAGLLNFYNGR